MKAKPASTEAIQYAQEAFSSTHHELFMKRARIARFPVAKA